MKKKFLIVLLTAVLLVTGCNNKVEDEKNNKVEEQQNKVDEENNDVVENENNVEIEKNPDAGKYNVDFYLFYSESCGHCHNEREWIESVKNDYPYVEFHLYEVSQETELFRKVMTEFGVEDEYVPLTIIGNDYFVGYSESRNRKFIRYIEELSMKENCGVVDVIIKDGDVEACMNVNSEE